MLFPRAASQVASALSACRRLPQFFFMYRDEDMVYQDRAPSIHTYISLSIYLSLSIYIYRYIYIYIYIHTHIHTYTHALSWSALMPSVVPRGSPLANNSSECYHLFGAAQGKALDDRA